MIHIIFIMICILYIYIFILIVVGILKGNRGRLMMRQEDSTFLISVSPVR